MKQVKNDNNAVWRSMFRIVDVMREKNSEAQDKMFYRLTYNQLRMIHRVYLFMGENDGKGISLKVLAERLGITPAAASEMVNTLVKKEVLTRNVDANDRRAIVICVADQLLKRFKRSESNFDRITGDFLQSLEPEECSIFLDVLSRWAGHVKENFSENGGKKND